MQPLPGRAPSRLSPEQFLLRGRSLQMLDSKSGTTIACASRHMRCASVQGCSAHHPYPSSRTAAGAASACRPQTQVLGETALEEAPLYPKASSGSGTEAIQSQSFATDVDSLQSFFPGTTPLVVFHCSCILSCCSHKNIHEDTTVLPRNRAHNTLALQPLSGQNSWC